jgi:uncharacterized protein YcaQ
MIPGVAMITLSNRQARQFMLLKHGLLGGYKFTGKQGALDFVRQAGCIQFDPVDACGKNAELTLQSRVRGFTKKVLYDLLYRDRKLVDYPDKNFPLFRLRTGRILNVTAKLPEREALSSKGWLDWKSGKGSYQKHGPVSSDELPINGSINWHSSIHWSGNWQGCTKASRSVLEQLYSTGELVIHHKNGTRKYYDLAEKHIPSELLAMPDPTPDEFQHVKWRILRRIGAVGLMWDRPSDAWLNIWGLDARQRSEAFRQLAGEGKILDIRVEGLKDVLFCRSEDLPIIEEVLQNDSFRPRCELIAPLDCMIGTGSLFA